MNLSRTWIGAAVAALLIGISGCGSSSGNFVPTPSIPIASTGTIELRQPLAREVAGYITQLQFVGFEEEGQVVYRHGPVAKADRIILDQVPTQMTSLRIEYLARRGVAGSFETDIVIRPGQTTLLENPDWTNTAPGTADFESSSVTLAEGSGPLAVALVHLDGDERLDAVTADTTSGGVSVLMSQGEGTFASPVFYATGTSAAAVRAADFNSDGHQDLAVANYGTPAVDGFVSVLLGDGQGGFTSTRQLIAGDGPTEVALADLNNDGNIDLISCDLLSDSVTVFLGDGAGEFVRDGAYETGNRPRALALGDLDGDGELDLFTANEGAPGAGDVSILLGRGDGTFGPTSLLTAGQNCHSVALGDLDGDGHLDAVVANFFSNEISVFLGNGDGTFETSVQYPTDRIPLNVSLDDFDGDGRLDVAVATSGDGLLNLFPGMGDGTLASRSVFTAGEVSFFVTSGDIDGDGKPDLAVANQGSDDLSLFLNRTEF